MLFQRLSLMLTSSLIVELLTNVRKRLDARQRYRDIRRETFKIIKSTLVIAPRGLFIRVRELRMR